MQPLWTAFEKTPHLDAGARVVLAVSGGADSRALMEAMARWKLRHRLDAVVVVSMDHGIRATAKEDVESVCARARALGFDVEPTVLHAFGKSDEGSLRDLRLRMLVRIARSHRAGAILFGHHRDDVAEGFLLGALGFSQALHMAPTSVFRSPDEKDEAFDDVHLVRPFLELSRAALRTALTAMNAPPASVDDEDMREKNMRAVLRRRAMLPLEQVQPRTSERLAAVARRITSGAAGQGTGRKNAKDP